jgi:hypothetical protein
VAPAEAVGRRTKTTIKKRIVRINRAFEILKLPLNHFKLRFDHVA